MYEIEKNIPISDGYGITDFLRKMEIGDSAVVPAKQRASISTCGKQIGLIIKTRKIDDENVRIWRMA